MTKEQMIINIQILYKSFADMADYMESISEHGSATSYRICSNRIHELFLPIIEKPVSKRTGAERLIEMNKYAVGFDVESYKPIDIIVSAPDDYTAVMNATFMFQVMHEHDLCYLNKIEFVKEVTDEREEESADDLTEDNCSTPEAPEQEREEDNTDNLTADNGSTQEEDKHDYDIVMECQCTDEYDSFVKLLKSGVHGAGYEESFLISQLPSDFISSVSSALFDYFNEGDHSQRKYYNEVNLLLCGYQFNAYIEEYSSSVYIVYFGDDTLDIGSYVYSLVYDDFTGDFIDVSLSDDTADNWEGIKDNVLTEVRKVLHNDDDPSSDDELPF